MTQIFSSFDNFRNLQASEFEWIESMAQAETHQPGTVLIKAGKFSPCIYLCLNGSLTATSSQADDSKQQLMEISAGELIGETSLLDDRPDLCSVTVTETAQLLTIPKHNIEHRLQSDRDFAASFYHLLSINLSERLRKLTNLMGKQNIREGEPLRKVLVVFAVLNDSDISWMVANGRAEKAALNTVLIQQNREVPAVYLLLEGLVGIYLQINNNYGVQEKEIAKRVKGEILGDMSFVDGGTASVTVKALENAWILAISRQTLTAKLKADRAFASRFYRSIALTLANRCLDLLARSSTAMLSSETVEMLSADIEVEDELDLDMLARTAIAGTRFDWMINQLRR
ncbi:cyclic nucleotide-binding domain-containing protein [Nostoc sp. DSM 114160]|jgi:bacteriocin-type transport-associated protein